MRTRVIGFAFCLIGLLAFPVGQSVAEQNAIDYQISIDDVQLDVQKNWLKIPHAATCTVTWKPFEVADENLEPRSVADFDSFSVQLLNKTKGISENQVLSNTSECTFNHLTIGDEYSVMVRGYLGDNAPVVSEAANLIVGKESVLVSKGPSSFRWKKYNPLRILSGRIPMAVFKRGEVFDSSTKPGKMAFHLIWWFFLAGSVIVILYSVPRLRLAKIFPLEKKFTFNRSLDQMYVNRKNKEFEKILVEWKEIIEEANQYINQKIHGENFGCMNDIQSANVEFWKQHGSKKIKALRKRLDDLEVSYLKLSDKDKLIGAMEPYNKQLPTIQIIRAGLDNHELGGYRWLEVSQEVDRAIENRAASELETLRRKSYIDWLWNLGTLAPLVGLFGTASGISHAFAMLSMTMGRGADISQATIVRRLSGGIFEALWTTIEGLFIGIIFMLIYYYYHNKLNWIYAKWEEMYVWITERL